MPNESSETSILPPSRLNPKLTRRAPPPTIEVESSFSNLEVTNPRIALLHSGTWIPKQYENGRHVTGTGLWTCCNDIDHFSMYCESEALRKQIVDKKIQKENEEKAQASYKDHIIETLKKPWERRELGVGAELDKLETPEEKAIRESNTFGNPFNAPMLISWVYKHIDEELTLIQGLNYIKNHVETGDGCTLMLRNDVLMCILKVYEENKLKPPVLLFCISILRKLLDCNFTRDKIICFSGPGYNALSALRMSFGILHSQMDSRSHVEEALKCIMQCSRSEICRKDILERKILNYVHETCKMYSKSPDILRSAIRLFNWTANTVQKLSLVCETGAVKTILQSMKRHINDYKVVSPGMQYLARVSRHYPPGAAYMLQNKAIEIIIGAIKALYSDEVLQLEGLKILQMMARTTEGWKQISDIKGGWQAICQGTTGGDALVHELPGDLHNPGWCIGDTPHLTIIDKAKIKASEASASITREAPKAAWTAHALKDFMGLSMKSQRLALNNEFHDMQFSLLSTLDLLPRPGEEKEYYFIRLNEYEKESDISIDEMTQTMIDMKKAAELKAKKIGQSEESGEVIKPIYFMGTKYSSAALDEADVNIVEELHQSILLEQDEDKKNTN